MTAGANPLTAAAIQWTSIGPPTPAVQFRAYVNAFERLGYDVDRLLEAIGFPRSEADDPDALISCDVCGALFKQASQERPLKNLPVRLAAETPIGTFELLDYLIVTSETVGDGLRQFARYVVLVAPSLRIDIHSDEDPIRIEWVGPPSASFGIEYSVTLVVRNLRVETEDRVSFESVSFRHQPDDVSEIEFVLGCPVRVGAPWSGLSMPGSSWHVPLRRRDPTLRRLLESHTRAVPAQLPTTETLAADLRRVLSSRLARGHTEIEAVARDLGMSSRTLQRRLSHHGLSYQQVLDRMRREVAERSIADSSLSIGEVAYLVGYSEPAAFHRAFRRWTAPLRKPTVKACALAALDDPSQAKKGGSVDAV
jgi:AraC-like DNA-binding protein